MFKNKTKVFCGKSLAVIIVLFLASLLLINNDVSASTYSTSITASSSVSINVSVSGKGASVSSDNIVINSTCPSGYTVSISGPTDSTLYKDGDDSNTASTTKINASTGTKQNPVSILGNNVKTWGYSLGTYSGNTHTPATINSNFIGLTSSIVELTNKNSASAQGGDTIPIYYGVSVDSDIEAGLYSMAESSQGANDNIITYYLTTSLDCTSYQVAFNPTSIIGGTTLSGTGTMSNQRIEEGVPTNLTTNTYTAPTNYYFAGWNTSQDGTGISYTDGQQVTDLTTVGQTITLYAQWTDCPPNKICYDKNQGTDSTNQVVGTMGQQTITSSDTSTTLLASNYSRTNYGFAGWNTKADGTGTNLGPQETIDFAAGAYSNAGLKLYAKWIASAGNIQSWNGCATLSIGDVTALKDQRDNQVYAVARLADGNCWMIENLRLNDNADHNSDGTLAQGYGTSTTYGNFSGLAEPESAERFGNVATANSLYYSGTQSGTATIDIGTGTLPASRLPRYSNINTASRASNPTSSDDALYSYGNYYTWSAAIADTSAYITNNQSVSSSSICPSNWRLPTAGDDDMSQVSDLRILIETLVGYGPNETWLTNRSRYSDVGGGIQGTNASRIMRSFPNNNVYSGYATGDGSSGSITGRGTSGSIWPATLANDDSAYSLTIGANEVRPGTNGSSKSRGRAIRCIVEPRYSIVYDGNGADSGSTMSIQNENVEEGQTTQLHPSNFKHSGYGFAGWSTTQINPDASNASSLIANAKIFGPQETITLSRDEIATADSNGVITLYAVWVKSAGNLQNWSGCSSLSSGGVTALKDTRDNQVYAVAKLADGKCWMIENFRLDNTATLTTSNTNNPLHSGSTVTLVNDDGNTTNHLSTTSSSWCTDNNSACIDQSKLDTSNTTNTVAYMTDDNQNIYSYGNYYNWYSATGGYGTHSFATTNNSVSGDICPSGWRLPIGGDNSNASINDFLHLATAVVGYGPNVEEYTNRSAYLDDSGGTQGTDASNAMRSYPNNNVYSGMRSGSSISGRSAYAGQWASTASTSGLAHGIAINIDVLRPGTWRQDKFAGRSIRCILGS